MDILKVDVVGKRQSYEERYIKALRAEAAAVRSYTDAMHPPVIEQELERQEALYKKAVAERKAALKALEELDGYRE